MEAGGYKYFKEALGVFWHLLQNPLQGKLSIRCFFKIIADSTPREFEH